MIVRDWLTDYGVGAGAAVSDSVEPEGAEDGSVVVVVAGASVGVVVTGASVGAGVAVAAAFDVDAFDPEDEVEEEDDEDELLFFAGDDEAEAELELFFVLDADEVEVPVFFVVLVLVPVVFFVAVELDDPPVPSFLCAAHETQSAAAAERATRDKQNFFIVVLVTRRDCRFADQTASN
jgi:F0F1-type ATP synthase membrane subunit c/vacuolar-type H+-ATPase subunit K